MGQADNLAIDLNRALPALPTHSSSHILSNPLSNPSSSTSQPTENTEGRLTGSTLTPSASVSKQKFQNLTHEFLIPSTPQYSPRTTDKLGLLDPVKYSPVEGNVENSNMPTANSAHKELSTMDSYRDLRFTQVEDMYNDAVQCNDVPQYVDSSMNSVFNDGKGRAVHVTPQHGAAKTYYKPHGMSQSLSETDFYDRRQQRAPAVIRSPHFEMGDIERESPLLSINKGLDSPPESPTRRGRPINRTPSPVKLEDIKEDQPMNFPSSPIKRSRSPVKQLFGENGWLGRSTSMKEMPSEEFRKNGIKHWGGKLKQRVELITEDVSKLIHHHESPTKKSPAETPVKKSKFPVSLGPPVQARLYSEIELMICATANQYLMTQHLEGRMTVESIAKITYFWTSKNRPQVIEFMFDQLTQRDLVLYNIKTFRFYGPNAENPVSMHAMMLSWRSLAKEMNVRTFCQPDSVVRKHMHDCYKILEMLGAPLVTFLAFQEIQVKALKLMKEKQQLRDQHEKIQFGMERRWEPPAGKVSNESDEMDDPFVG